ncbi:MAG: response regulator [Spirochaetales bacterium]|nr:response regulator [Spirochaetales bacterium]
MKNILLVDDSTAIRNILKTSLFGDFRIFEADNGQAAIDKAVETQMDFFLMDVNMPIMDGLTALKKIKAMPQYEKTPVVMLTTETRDEKKNVAKDAGANGWIIKPCDPAKLLNVIKKLI